jgi:hypothetical protein
MGHIRDRNIEENKGHIRLHIEENKGHIRLQY